jgi:hypothetical protein
MAGCRVATCGELAGVIVIFACTLRAASGRQRVLGDGALGASGFRVIIIFDCTLLAAVRQTALAECRVAARASSRASSSSCSDLHYQTCCSFFTRPAPCCPVGRQRTEGLGQPLPARPDLCGPAGQAALPPSPLEGNRT